MITADNGAGLNQRAAYMGGRVNPVAGKLRSHPSSGPPLKDHHVIPYNRLRDVWNTLVWSHSGSGVEAFLGLFSPDEAFTAKVMAFVRDDENAANHEIGLTSGGLGRHAGSPMSGDVIAQELFWAPFNLVEGPGERIDDPGSGTDRFSFSGLPAGQRAALDARRVYLQDLSDTMKAFVQAHHVAENPPVPTRKERRRPGFQEPDHHREFAIARDNLIARLGAGITFRDADRVDFRDTRQMWEVSRGTGDGSSGETYRNVGRDRRNSVLALDPDDGRRQWSPLEADG